MMNIMIVGIGGFLGSVSRYLIGGLVQEMFHTYRFPYGTLSVNVIGCFLIGLFYGLGETKGLPAPEVRLLIGTGFIGGFTTFSAFGYETMTLTRFGEPMSALANLLLHLLIGIGAVWAGDAMSRIF
ncbi:MAG: fluoride efflux transporter CrcB [Deltaproteobacteria bacterium]|nr:fluoride efflux transporter CrcB [Deltaproteobacteria bacterium]